MIPLLMGNCGRTHLCLGLCSLVGQRAGFCELVWDYVGKANEYVDG
jgi:hypothetical protein